MISDYSNYNNDILIKSPRGWLYVFVPVRTPPPPSADSCSHSITFEQRFGFLLFWHDYWPWPIDYLIWCWLIFVVTLTLDFQGQIWILLYLSQNGPIATERKTNILIEIQASNVTFEFDLGHDLDLDYSRSNMEFAIPQPKMARLPRNGKQTYPLNPWPQM